jgi:phenylacetate-CoA ligase
VRGTLLAGVGLGLGGRLRGAALERHQMRRLRGLARRAARAVPLYAELFASAGVRAEDLRTLADLERLPVIRRDEVDASRMVETGVDLARCVTRRTGGSTGRAMTVVTRRADLEVEALGWLRTWRRLGLRWTDRQTALKEPTDTFHEGRRRWFQRLGLLRVSHLDLFRPPEELRAAVRALAPDVLRGPPSALEGIAAVSAPGEIRPRLVFTTGERLSPKARERLRAAFGAPVHDCYGATEAGCIAWRCPSCDLYHVNADQVIVEVVESGRAVPPGETGDVVVTNLFARAMPFLRYALGDRARVERNACPASGAPLAIAELAGRTVEQIVLPDGRLVSPYHFMPDEVAGVRASAAVQTGPREVRILVVPEAGFREEELAAMCRVYEERTGGACRVTWEIVESLPGTPAERFRRVLPGAGAPSPSGRA